MTVANIITLFRIALIPCFVTAAVYYAVGFKAGAPQEWERWMAVIFFVTATVTDGVDGFVARRFHQSSRLGSILDPLADKALLLSALVLLTINVGNAFPSIPLWFPIMIVSRDVVVVIGVAVVFFMGRHPIIKPHWSGKVGTVLQMITVGMLLLKLPDPWWLTVLVCAAVTTVISGGIYVVQGLKHLGH